MNNIRKNKILQKGLLLKFELIYYPFNVRYTFPLLEQSQFSQQGTNGWIEWFCNLQDHQFFAEVDQQFIKDNFNLYGIKQKFNNYNTAIHMILKPQPPEQAQLQDQKFLQIYQQATDIYGLIHSRFILTAKGISIMRQKFLAGKFGTCPRVMCQKQNCIPIGMSEDIHTARVKLFCPRCEDVYFPKRKCQDIDGAFFGTSFPQILLMTFKDLIPAKNDLQFIPRIYGFKIFKKKGSVFFDQDKQNKRLQNNKVQKKIKIKD